MGDGMVAMVRESVDQGKTLHSAGTPTDTGMLDGSSLASRHLIPDLQQACHNKLQNATERHTRPHFVFVAGGPQSH